MSVKTHQKTKLVPVNRSVALLPERDAHVSPILECIDLGVTFGGLKAVDNFDITIGRTEIAGLIGPNGAGKTTIFNLLTKVYQPTHGTILLDGKDIHGMTTTQVNRAGIARTFQNIRLFTDLTVEENLNFFATLFGTSVRENYHLVEDIYKQIEPFKTRRAGKLSGGMKQKLALSCALIHKPVVLLLDEPPTGVDPVSRKEFWEMLRRLKREGITIIVSTPYLDEIRSCDRMAFLYGGTVKGIDTPAVMWERYADILSPPGLQREPAGARSECAIEVHDLVKRFGTFTAVDHISFRVGKGEIFGFLGANGAGKTTAMRMLCGLSYPTSGTGRVAGFDINTQQEEIKKHIGYMSQKFSLYDDLKVWENIRLFAGIYGLSDEVIARRTDEVLHTLGLEAERNTMVKSLPLGWKQKLAFSVATFHRPDIVFLDEPTGGVDPKTRRQFWELIYQAADQGITIFVTTHYMDEAEFCGRVSIMVDGKIRALDTPGGLKRTFGEKDMDGVFHRLAREATRNAEICG